MDTTSLQRTTYFPQHASYYKMFPVYRPFIYWINEPSFKSDFVNTDEYGLRYNYLHDGSRIDIRNVSRDFEYCDLILGGSTVFGVDASHDRSTISYYLSADGIPCINLGNRGATSYQELLLFIFYRQLFGKIRNIYLLSGVNDCSLASLEGSVIYDEFGGVFGQDHYMTYPYMSHLTACYDELSFSRWRFYNALERRYRDGKLFRQIFSSVLKKLYKGDAAKSSREDKRKSFERKIEQNILNLKNQFSAWRSIADGNNARLFYFLQPCVYWNDKQLSPIEQQFMDDDMRVAPSLKLYANKTFHERYSSHISKIAAECQIPFYDINQAVSTVDPDVTFFTDVCHLTDAGNKVVADYILKTPH